MHREIITLESLNLTEDDFNFELLNIHDYKEEFKVGYKLIDVSINGCKFSLSFNISADFIQDMCALRYDFDDMFENAIKTESIFYYINNKKLIRKSKLKRLREIND